MRPTPENYKTMKLSTSISQLYSLNLHRTDLVRIDAITVQRLELQATVSWAKEEDQHQPAVAEDL